MTNIIERLRNSQASGSDRELDAEIAVASGAYVFEAREGDRKPWYYRVEDGGNPLYHRRSVPPEYSMCFGHIAALNAGGGE